MADKKKTEPKRVNPIDWHPEEHAETFSMTLQGGYSTCRALRMFDYNGMIVERDQVLKLSNAERYRLTLQGIVTPYMVNVDERLGKPVTYFKGGVREFLENVLKDQFHYGRAPEPYGEGDYDIPLDDRHRYFVRIEDSEGGKAYVPYILRDYAADWLKGRVRWDAVSADPDSEIYERIDAPLVRVFMLRDFTDWLECCKPQRAGVEVELYEPAADRAIFEGKAVPADVPVVLMRQLKPFEDDWLNRFNPFHPVRLRSMHDGDFWATEEHAAELKAQGVAVPVSEVESPKAAAALDAATAALDAAAEAEGLERESEPVATASTRGLVYGLGFRF